jgi:hypothetical protein
MGAAFASSRFIGWSPSSSSMVRKTLTDELDGVLGDDEPSRHGPRV